MREAIPDQHDRILLASAVRSSDSALPSLPLSYHPSHLNGLYGPPKLPIASEAKHAQELVAVDQNNSQKLEVCDLGRKVPPVRPPLLPKITPRKAGMKGTKRLMLRSPFPCGELGGGPQHHFFKSYPRNQGYAGTSSHDMLSRGNHPCLGDDSGCCGPG